MVVTLIKKSEKGEKVIWNVYNDSDKQSNETKLITIEGEKFGNNSSLEKSLVKLIQVMIQLRDK